MIYSFPMVANGIGRGGGEELHAVGKHEFQKSTDMNSGGNGGDGLASSVILYYIFCILYYLILYIIISYHIFIFLYSIFLSYLYMHSILGLFQTMRGKQQSSLSLMMVAARA